MRNIPNFTCEYGIANLVLQEIPRSGNAYCLKVFAAEGCESQLLTECRRFCRMAGAERVFALGDGGEPAITILSMAVLKESLGQTDACLWPVMPENAEDYRRIYNDAMKPIPAALSLTKKDMEGLEGAYFVHRGGELLGIGQVTDGELRAIASCVPGSGRDVALALLSAVTEERATLKVASTNLRAIRLYEKLGFVTTGIAETWFEI